MTRAIKLLAFIALYLHASFAYASGTILVGTTGDYQPVSWQDPTSGEFRGDDIDLIKAFAHDTGREVKFVQTSWPTLMEDLTAGKFMLAVGGISYTQDRATLSHTSDTIRTDGKVALVRCGEQLEYDTLRQIDRPGVRVVENPGGTNEKFARTTLKSADLKIMEDNHAPFRALQSGQADVMFTDGIEALYMERQDTGLCAVKPDKPYTVIRKVFLFRHDHEELRDAFNSWWKTRETALFTAQ